jgi:hypothetical protein
MLDAWRFARLFSPHVVAAPIVFFTVVTFLHELAHAAMALLLGATVTSLEFLPADGHLGVTRYTRPASWSVVDDALVAGAPYLMWLVVAGVVVAVALLRNQLHWLVATTLFLWGFVVPLGDIAWNAFSGGGDLAVPGPLGVVVQLGVAFLLVCAAFAGFFIARRLFGERAPSFKGYLLSAFIVGPALGVAGFVGLALWS